MTTYVHFVSFMEPIMETTRNFCHSDMKCGERYTADPFYEVQIKGNLIIMYM